MGSKSEGRGWFKSSLSNGSCACLEITFVDRLVLIRDSKYLLDPANDSHLQPMLSVNHAQWVHFVTAVRSGIKPTSDAGLQATATVEGGMSLTTPGSNVVLTYSADEWMAFVGGVNNAEFDRVAVAV
ncbi:MAG: DUF397 domain-containing protein [bacterium]|nr:DUF397 domain-containing protein [bacterium]